MRPTSSDSASRRIGILALAGAIYTYILVVYGGIVRITGSGMGCGDDWPNCNNALVPTFTLHTFIEYTHRLLAGGLALLTLALFIAALRRRRDPAIGGPGHLTRPAYLAAGLIIVQVLLGAITVKLELPAGVTAVHFMVAMTLLATFLTMAARAGIFGTGRDDLAAVPGPTTITALATLAFIVVAFGALTANLGMIGPFPPSGAALACQGFPFCNGQLWPDGGSWVHTHWTHRFLAFTLFFATLWAAWRARHAASAALRRTALIAAALVTAQVAIAAGLVLMELPQFMQAAHLAVGALVWASLVTWTLLSRRAARPAVAAPSTVIA